MINFNYKNCFMQINNHLLSFNQGFSSPLRLIDQNISGRVFTSPNCLPKFSLSQAHPLKRRFTQASQLQKSQNPMIKSIKISYKQNVSAQVQLKQFSSIKGNQHPRDNLVRSIQFQPMHQTDSNKFSLTSKRLLRPVSIQPFELSDPIMEQPSKLIRKDYEAQLNVNDFCKLKELGKGKFGTVWLVRHKTTNFLCAMKVIKKSVVREEKVQHQVAKELRIHNTLKHINIIGFYGFFHDQENFYILTQYATGGQIYSLIKKKFRLSQDQVAPIVRQTAEGLQFMHNLGFIHRDIKPENLILQFDTIKICDLGWAAQCSYNQMRKSICGTPLYYSPEVVRQGEHNGLIDVWSLGILTYQLLVGRIPFKIWSEFDLPVILEQQVTFPDYIDFEDDTKDFILLCLAKIANLRPTISALNNHPFFKHKKKDTSLSLYQDVKTVF